MLFGTNKAKYDKLASDVGGITAVRLFVKGIPSTFPGGPNPAEPGVVQIVTFNPEGMIPSILAGKHDKEIQQWMTAAPSGTLLGCRHEGNLPQHHIPGPQFCELQLYLQELKNRTRGDVIWTVIYGGSHSVKGYVPVGMDLYGLDGYQRAHTDTADTRFGPMYDNIKEIYPYAEIGLTETNTTFLNTQADWFKQTFEWAYERGFRSYLPFFGSTTSPGGEAAAPYPTDPTTIGVLQEIAREAALVGAIP